MIMTAMKSLFFLGFLGESQFENSYQYAVPLLFRLTFDLVWYVVCCLIIRVGLLAMLGCFSR